MTILQYSMIAILGVFSTIGFLLHGDLEDEEVT